MALDCRDLLPVPRVALQGGEALSGQESFSISLLDDFDTEVFPSSRGVGTFVPSL